MINCPKCGFEQPPDRYCAQCGINMETFRAPTPPLVRRLAGSGAFLGFLIGVVIFATTFLIYNHRKAELRAQNEINSGFTADAPPAKQAPAAAPPSTTLAEAEETAPDQAEDLAQSQPAMKQNPPPTSTTFTPPSTTVNPVAGTNVRSERKLNLNIYFAEVPLSALPVLFSGLSEAGQSGVVPDFSTRISQLAVSKAGENIRFLKESKESVQSGSVKVRQSLQGGMGRGLSVSVVTRGGGDSLSVEMNIENKGMMSGNFGSDLSLQNFQGNFELPLKAAAYFADVISKPSGLPPEMEADLSKDPVFKILNNPSFIQRQTSFFIFVENPTENSTAVNQ